MGSDPNHPGDVDPTSDNEPECMVANDCTEAQPCTRPICVGGVCATEPDLQVSCDDGDPCSVNDICKTEGCSGTAKSCSYLDGDCVTGQCQPSSGDCVTNLVVNGIPCDVGTCSSSDSCQAGVCEPGLSDRDADGDGFVDSQCPQGDDCEDGLFDVKPGALEEPYSAAVCDDGLDNNCDGETDLEEDSCWPQLGTWAPTTSMLTPRTDHAQIVADGTLFVVAGRNDSGTMAGVEASEIQPDGSLGTWSAKAVIQDARFSAVGVTHGGYVYVIAGRQGGTRLSSVEYATSLGSGNLSAWSYTEALTHGRSSPAAATYDGFVYCVGGHDGTDYVPQVERAAFNPDGTLDAWQEVGSLNNPRGSPAAIVLHDRLWVVGGWLTDQATASVESAPLTPGSGNLGTFIPAADLPIARSNHAGVGFDRFVLVSAGDDEPAMFSDFWAGAMAADGSVGPWRSYGTIGTARTGHSMLLTGNTIVIIGGWDGVGIFFADAQKTSIP